MRRESLDLIFTLVKNNEKKLNLKDLSEYLDVSERTIRYEIEHANYFLDENNLSQISLVENQYVNHELELIDLQEIIPMIKETPFILNSKERQAFIVFNTLRKSGLKFAYLWKKELEVSKSTIDKDVRSVRSLVKKFNLELKSFGKKGYKIIGSEWSKRELLHFVVAENISVEDLLDGYAMRKIYSYPVLDVGSYVVLHYLDHSLIYQIYEFLLENLQASEAQYDQIKLMNLSLLITIWLSRLEEGTLLREDEIILNKNNRIHACDLVPLIKEKFLHEIKITNYYEDYYLSYYFDGYEIRQNHNLGNDWANLQVLTINFISDVEKLMGLPFSTDSSLFEGLYEHIKSLANRIEKNILINNPLEEMVKNQYKTVFDAVYSASKKLEDYFESKISDSELSYIAIHFSASKEKLLKSKKSLYRVAIICGHGVATGELLSKNMEKTFPIEVVGIFELSAMKNIKTLDIDFAVSTVDVQLNGIETIVVNPMLREIDKKIISQYMLENPINHYNIDSEVDIQKLFNEIAELILIESNPNERLNLLFDTFIRNGLKVKKEGIQPMIHEVLCEEHIQIKKKVRNWEEGIKLASQPLLDDGFVNEAYVKSMINSVKELGPYIVLDKGIALAHATPGEDVKKLGLSVLTLKDPINFGHEENDPVEIIFCLAAVDGYSHLKIMKTLVNVINHRWKLDALIMAESSCEFLKLVESYEKDEEDGKEDSYA